MATNYRPLKVLITEPIHKEGMKLLNREFNVQLASDIKESILIKEIKDCQALIVRIARINKIIIDNAPYLKIISRHGVGIDNIDVDAATKRRILVTNAKGSNTDSVAEHALGMILALAKNIISMDKAVKEGNFKIRYNFFSNEIKGKTVGIVGFGEIGQALAKKLTALEVKIIAYDPYIVSMDKIMPGVMFVKNLDNILTDSDIISIHVPYTKETFHMIGEKEFQKMKKNTFFINVSRGEIVDEVALFDALNQGIIRASAIDVFEKEPPERGNPLFKLNNILLSPHNAALTEEAMVRMAVTCVMNIIDYFNDRKPRNILNPEVL